MDTAMDPELESLRAVLKERRGEANLAARRQREAEDAIRARSEKLVRDYLQAHPEHGKAGVAHLTVSDPTWGYDCTEVSNPVGKCVYGDGDEDECLFCGAPDERK